ncbi:hypothetical protein PMIN03_006961 [Paraphaeosphaeria minitans]
MHSLKAQAPTLTLHKAAAIYGVKGRGWLFVEMQACTVRTRVKIIMAPTATISQIKCPQKSRRDRRRKTMCRNRVQPRASERECPSHATTTPYPQSPSASATSPQSMAIATMAAEEGNHLGGEDAAAWRILK